MYVGLLRAVCLWVVLHRVLSTGFKFRFQHDATFKVLQLTDLHLGESAAKDKGTIQVVKSVLGAEPDVDLVVLSGDMVSGFAQPYSNVAWHVTYHELIGVFEAAGKRHAVVLGNHDDESVLNRRDIVALDQTFRLSATQGGPENVTGATNYWIDIESARGGGLGGRLYFLDSMDRGCEGLEGWGCVGHDTVDWLLKASAPVAHAAVAAAFVHIPVPEFMSAWNLGTSAVGHKGEATCCPPYNTGAASALRSIGATAIYSGHDHDNDFAVVWEGMRFAYGRKTGYGSYGPPEGFLRGGRVIILREGECASRSETYFRLENGNKVVQERSTSRGAQLTCSTSAELFKKVDEDKVGKIFPEDAHLEML